MGRDPHSLWILGVSVAALLVGPGIHALARREPTTMAALDNFVLVVVVGLVTLEIVPGALHLAGPLGFAALLLGALGPALADGPLQRASHGTHSAALALAIVGVAVHSFTDGLALATAHVAGSHGHAIEAAVIAHQLPVAVAVWWLLAPVGPLRASIAMLGLGLATVAGFVLADQSINALAPAWVGALQALFAGFLLHVLAHRSPPASDRRRARWAASIGGLGGLALLVLFALDAGHEHADDPLGRMLADLLRLARAAAPPLLAALAIGAVAGRFAPERRATDGPSPAASTSLLERPGLPAQLDHAAPWLTAGLLISATLLPFLPASPLPAVGPALQVPLFAFLGVPAHVFVPAAIPLVALLVAAGLGPGAALAFLLAGPATALAVRRSANKPAPALVAMRAGLLAAVLGLGLVLDLHVIPFAALPGYEHADDVAAVVLAGLLLASLVRQTPQQFLRALWSRPGARSHGHAHAHSHARPHEHHTH